MLIQGFWEWFCRPLLPSSFLLWSRYVSESIIEGLPTKESVSAYGITDLGDFLCVYPIPQGVWRYLRVIGSVCRLGVIGKVLYFAIQQKTEHWDIT